MFERDEKGRLWFLWTGDGSFVWLSKPARRRVHRAHDGSLWIYIDSRKQRVGPL